MLRGTAEIHHNPVTRVIRVRFGRAAATKANVARTDEPAPSAIGGTPWPKAQGGQPRNPTYTRPRIGIGRSDLTALMHEVDSKRPVGRHVALLWIDASTHPRPRLELIMCQVPLYEVVPRRGSAAEYERDIRLSGRNDKEARWWQCK